LWRSEATGGSIWLGLTIATSHRRLRRTRNQARVSITRKATANSFLLFRQTVVARSRETNAWQLMFVPAARQRWQSRPMVGCMRVGDKFYQATFVTLRWLVLVMVARLLRNR